LRFISHRKVDGRIIITGRMLIDGTFSVAALVQLPYFEHLLKKIKKTPRCLLKIA